jgi:type III pantothenate kinase
MSVDLLLIDVGNSRTKWAVCRAGDEVGVPFRAAGAFFNAELAAEVPSAWRNCRRAMISSVADHAVTAGMADLLKTVDIDTHYVKSTMEACGLRNGYADPRQLGIDRWMAALAAWHHCRGPCIVASAGTALTVDAIGTENGGDRGLFLGGLIVPGFRLMQQSLRHGTAGLDVVAGAMRDFPDNTGDGMHSGAIAAMHGAVTYMLRQLQVRENRPPRCILGGGDAELLIRAFAVREEAGIEVTMIDNLVLQGLQLIEREYP